MDKAEMVQMIVNTCHDKQAKDIVVLDMKQISLVADYFFICHASNGPQVQAIAKSIKEALEKKEIIINQMEGFAQARWIVIDTGYVLCHIFHEDERDFYNLERLWGDASRVPLQIGQD